jgi:transposase InsO family protein
MTRDPLPSVDILRLLAPFRSGSEMPLGFYEDRCLKCGSSLSPFGNRKNGMRIKKKWVCSKCGAFVTLGFDRGAHVPLWVYDRVLFSMAKSYRNTDIQLEVKIASKNYGPPFWISVPTIYRIARSSLSLFERFEPVALRGLLTKPISGIWCMDDRFHDLPFDQSLFPDKKLNPRKGNPHMYPTVVIDEKTNYDFSVCVSRKRDKFVAMRALVLALDRAGGPPDKLKIDEAKGLYAAAIDRLPPERILCICKKKDFAFNNAVEMWFSHYGLRHNKHECQYKRPWTQECSMNIYRYYRNYIRPFKETGKTPAELLGLALPRNINNEISFIPLLEFAYRLTNFIESELARAKFKCL